MAKIHIVDDEEFDLRALETVLKGAGHEVIGSMSAEEALPKIIACPPDAILLDIRLPGMDGFDMCRRLRENPDTLNLPVMFITAWYTDEESLVRGLKLGSTDYVTKPVRSRELLARLSALLKTKEMVEHIRTISLNDPLTGLANRRLLIQRVSEEISRTKRDNTPFSVLMIDVDHFKSINDSFGHQAGDHVLQKVANVLRESLRREDLISRYGGDEFCVIMWPRRSESTETVAERLRAAVESQPVQLSEVRLNVTVTIGGIAIEKLDDSVKTEQLIASADRALYEAKRSGRNRIALATGSAIGFGDIVAEQAVSTV